MKCKRCEQDIEANAPEGVTICGSCADYLRQEEEAQIADIDFQMNKEAYERDEQEGLADNGGGYRFI